MGGEAEEVARPLGHVLVFLRRLPARIVHQHSRHHDRTQNRNAADRERCWQSVSPLLRSVWQVAAYLAIARQALANFAYRHIWQIVAQLREPLLQGVNLLADCVKIDVFVEIAGEFVHAHVRDSQGSGTRTSCGCNRSLQMPSSPSISLWIFASASSASCSLAKVSISSGPLALAITACRRKRGWPSLCSSLTMSNSSTSENV